MKPASAPSLTPLETRILLLAPTDADAAISERVLAGAELPVSVVKNIPALCYEMLRGAGAILMTEDAVLDENIEKLRSVINEQPVWSDLPIVLLVSGGASSEAALYALEKLGNILLLECPVRVNSLVSTMRVALRDRKRQYEARRYQTELLQQAETLWRSNKELEQFAYVSSHDLKEPLRKILNYAQLLEARFRPQLDGEGGKYIHMITDGADRMRNLIESLLAFSRLTKTEQKMEPIDLSRTLADVINDLELSIKEHGAKISVGVMPTLVVNALQMHQLFQNLVSNSLKFNQGAAEIRIDAEEKWDEWMIAVRDNGIGIEPEYRDKIFNVFARLHGRGQYPGTGIGLAICKKIVEAHGGRIWVESSLDKGATFFFTIAKEIKATPGRRASDGSTDIPEPSFVPASLG